MYHSLAVNSLATSMAKLTLIFVFPERRASFPAGERAALLHGVPHAGERAAVAGGRERPRRARPRAGARQPHAPAAAGHRARRLRGHRQVTHLTVICFTEVVYGT